MNETRTFPLDHHQPMELLRRYIVSNVEGAGVGLIVDSCCVTSRACRFKAPPAVLTSETTVVTMLPPAAEVVVFAAAVVVNAAVVVAALELIWEEVAVLLFTVEDPAAEAADCEFWALLLKLPERELLATTEEELF